MEKAIYNLIDLSKYASRHPEFVQGGGGNCSVKFKGKIAIKASGFFLKDVSLNNGFVLLDLKNKKPVLNKHLVPSLELPLHCLLNTYVIHTHPVVVGALVCAKEGKKIFRKIFKDKNYVWIDYANPGNKLLKMVKSAITKEKVLKEDLALFLENHGLLVSTSKKAACINLHEKIIKKLKTFFKHDTSNKYQNHQSATIKGYLTPDHVVYLNVNRNNLSKKNRLAIKEIKFFTDKVTALIKLKKLDVQYLNDKDCKFIVNMDAEKYRQQI